MTNLKTLDDYTKLPDGYTDYGTEKIFEKACNEALESLANEMIKRRIKNPPKIYMVSSEISKNDFLSFFKNDHIIDSFNYGIVTFLDFGANYKILKRRLTHGYRSGKKKPRLH